MPDELRADLQQFYGLNLDDMGAAYTASHAAALCAQLPSESRVARARGDGWSESERLLALIRQSVDVVWWQNTKDGRKKGAKPPEVVKSPNARRRTEYTRADMDGIAEALGIPPEMR